MGYDNFVMKESSRQGGLAQQQDPRNRLWRKNEVMRKNEDAFFMKYIILSIIVFFIFRTLKLKCLTIENII